MTTTISIAAHELALYIINDGKSYASRCELARRPLTSSVAAASLALGWIEHARRGAHDYHRDFGQSWASDVAIFTPADIIGCALELAEYYDEHVKEM